MLAGTVYTVGHSNRSLEDLVSIVTGASILTLVDVRAEPRSRHNPQFNEDSLRAACLNASVTYHWAGRHLGGLRTVRADSPHVALEGGLRGFADHMESEPFKKAAAQLIRIAASSPTTILCAEREPENCHRSLISDYLLLQGLRVIHLIGIDRRRDHLLSPQARRESASLVYNRNTNTELALDQPNLCEDSQSGLVPD